MTFRQRKDDVGLPCKNTLGSPSPSSTVAISIPPTSIRRFAYMSEVAPISLLLRSTKHDRNPRAVPVQTHASEFNALLQAATYRGRCLRASRPRYSQELTHHSDSCDTVALTRVRKSPSANLNHFPEGESMSNKFARLLALLMAMALFAAACGGSDSDSASTSDDGDSALSTGSDSDDDEAMDCLLYTPDAADE